MRVLFVADLGTDPPTGPQRFARAFSREMAQHVELRVVDISGGNKLSRARDIFSSHDICHVSGVAFLEHTLSALRARKNLVYTARGVLSLEKDMGFRYSRRMLWAEAFLLQRARLVCAHTRLLARKIAEAYGVPEHKLAVIPGGFAPEFTEPARPGDFLEGFGVRPPFILFVGKPLRLKGLHHALAALALARKQRSDLSMVVVGYPKRHRTRQPGVFWIESLPTRLVASAMAACSLLLNTSEYESGGNPPLEAAAQGKPVLVSRGAGASEWVEGFFPDLVVDPEDHEGIAEKILALLDSPPPAPRLREMARSFGMDGVVRAYLRVYDRIRSSA